MFGYTRKQLKAMSRKQLLKVLESVDRNTLTFNQNEFIDSLLKLPRLTEEELMHFSRLNKLISECYIPDEPIDEDNSDSVGITTIEKPYKKVSRKPDKLPPVVIKAYVTGQISKFEPYISQYSGHNERLKFVTEAIEEFLLVNKFH